MDIITWVWRTKHGGPSWVPDWSVHDMAHAFLENVVEPKYLYRASGLSKAEVSFLEGGTLMLMRGVKLAPIEAIGQPSGMKSRGDLRQAVLTFHRWRKLLLKIVREATIMMTTPMGTCRRLNFGWPKTKLSPEP
jgi:hypothetical protein